MSDQHPPPDDPQWPSSSGSSGSPPPEGTPPPPGGTPPPPPPPPPGSGTPPPPATPPTDQPQQGGQRPASGPGQPANVGIRLGARIIDGILLGIVNFVITSIIILPIIFSDPDTVNPMFAAGLSGAALLASLISIGITFGYFVFLETTRGQTVGKMLLGLEVRNTAGQYPTPEESLRRNAFMALGIVPILGGLLQLAAVIYIAVSISSAPDKRGWHDHFAGTAVAHTS